MEVFSMSTSENIKNSGLVLLKTYENVNKMMEQCRTSAPTAGYEKAPDEYDFIDSNNLYNI